MAKTVKSFYNYDFENCDVPEKYDGDYPHANYFKGEFIPVARRELRAMAKRIGAELTFSPAYFYFYAFFSKGGKHVYVNVGDVRYNIGGHWYDHVLYRTAASTKDYTGGPNRYTSYEGLEQAVADLLG